MKLFVYNNTDVPGEYGAECGVVIADSLNEAIEMVNNNPQVRGEANMNNVEEMSFDEKRICIYRFIFRMS